MDIDDDIQEVEEETVDDDSSDQTTDETEETTEETEETEETQSDIDALAMEMGWNPEHKGDREFVDAKTYIKRGHEIQETMRQSLNDQKRQISDLQYGIEELKKHNERVNKAEITRLTQEITKLKSERKEAIEAGDVDTVDDLDEQIKTMQDIVNQPDDNTERPIGPNPEFDDWHKSNNWYETDRELTMYADRQAELPEFQGLSQIKMLNAVTERVKKMFPDKFPGNGKGTGNRTTVQTVESATTTRHTKQGLTVDDLTVDERRAMKQFVKMGAMTAEEYLKDIAKIR